MKEPKSDHTILVQANQPQRAPQVRRVKLILNNLCAPLRPLRLDVKILVGLI